MSKKPEGIPEDAWRIAEGHALSALAVVAFDTIDQNDAAIASLTNVIARAILAAAEAEREACAAVLDVAANRQKEAWDEYMNSGGKGPATSFEGIFRGQAAAIRKREEE